MIARKIACGRQTIGFIENVLSHLTRTTCLQESKRSRTNLSLFLDRFHSFLRGIVEVSGGDDGQARLLQQLHAQLHVGALQAHHQWHLEAHVLGGGDDTLSDHIALHDTSEDVHQQSLHVGVGLQQLKGFLHLLGVGTATYIK